MNLLILTFMAGFLFTLSGVFGLCRHYLLEPRIPTEHRTPVWLLRVMFGFSTVMIYVGLRYLTSWATGEAITAPPAATGPSVIVAFTLAVYTGSLLYDSITRKASFTLDELIDRFKQL